MFGFFIPSATPQYRIHGIGRQLQIILADHERRRENNQIGRFFDSRRQSDYDLPHAICQHPP
jgi:hypothetical protein